MARSPRLTPCSAPTGVTSSYAYDGLSRLTGLTHATGATTLIGNQYQHNDASNITNWANASGNHAYGYDPVDRLTSATNSAQPNENYSYDGVGNRASSHLSASHNYQPFNKLTNTATASYTYDNNGNLISSTDSLGSTTFTWNEENQLTQVALPAGLTVNYKYDALGRRIQRTTSASANERYVYDGHDVLLDLNADWSVATTYLNGLGIDDHLRQTNSITGVSYFLTDHLGTTAALTDATGNIVEQLAYDTFGDSTGSARTRYGYTGREFDPDTGLMYYRARWYDPQVGRFISEDPIGFEGGDVNLYAYVRNNPANFRDPTGTQRSDRDRPLRIRIAKTIVCLVLCTLALCSCGSPSSQEDRIKLQELRTAYGNRYRFEFETGGLYLNAWSLVDKEPSKDEAKTIYKTFWFKDGQKRTDNTDYVYLNVFNKQGDFQVQVYWDSRKNDFGFSQTAYY